jgi:hypothetical protein
VDRVRVRTERAIELGVRRLDGRLVIVPADAHSISSGGSW